MDSYFQMTCPSVFLYIITHTPVYKNGFRGVRARYVKHMGLTAMNKHTYYLLPCMCEDHFHRETKNCVVQTTLLFHVGCNYLSISKFQQQLNATTVEAGISRIKYLLLFRKVIFTIIYPYPAPHARLANLRATTEVRGWISNFTPTT